MKPRDAAGPHGTSEMLILPDGRVLVHNLTVEVAAMLAKLNPADPHMGRRAGRLVARGRGRGVTVRGDGSKTYDDSRGN